MFIPTSSYFMRLHSGQVETVCEQVYVDARRVALWCAIYPWEPIFCLSLYWLHAVWCQGAVCKHLMSSFVYISVWV
jgi:hypothetical protein